MLKNIYTMKCQKSNNHTDKHTVPRHKEQGSYSKARPTVLKSSTRSIVAGATWIWITCFGGAAGRGPKIIQSHKKWTGTTNTLAYSYMYALFYVWRMITADKQRLYSETTLLLRATGCSLFNDGGKTGKSIKWNWTFCSLIYSEKTHIVVRISFIAEIQQ